MENKITIREAGAENDAPIAVEILSDPEDWQLKKLENSYLLEIGESPLTEKKQAQLARAIRAGRISTSSQRSAKRGSPGCWRGPHRAGAGKTALPA